jgi:hypothetical protein
LREDAELEDGNTHRFDVAPELHLRTGDGASGDGQGIGRQQADEALVGAGLDGVILSQGIAPVVRREGDLITQATRGGQVLHPIKIRRAEGSRHQRVDLGTRGRIVLVEQIAQIGGELLHSGFGAVEGLLPAAHVTAQALVGHDKPSKAHHHGRDE